MRLRSDRIGFPISSLPPAPTIRSYTIGSERQTAVKSRYTVEEDNNARLIQNEALCSHARTKSKQPAFLSRVRDIVIHFLIGDLTSIMNLLPISRLSRLYTETLSFLPVMIASFITNVQRIYPPV